MAASQWFILFEYVISFLCQSYSFYIFAKIIINLCKKGVKTTVHTSPSLNLYFIIQATASLAALIYMAFLLIGWRLDTTEYNAYLLYFFGGIPNILISLPPIAVFALGIDRCLCILYPIKYSKRQNYYPIYFAIILMTVISCFSLIHRIIAVFPTQPVTLCNSFGCLIPNNLVETYTYLRYFTSSLVLFTSVILLFVIRFKLSTKNNHLQTKKFNTTVLLTLVTTFALDFIPHLMGIIFYSIANMNLTVYTGPYSTVIGSVESAICAFFYRNIQKKENIVTIRPQQRLT